MVKTNQINAIKKSKIKQVVRELQCLKNYSDKHNLNQQNYFDWINEGRSEAYQDAINLLNEVLSD